MLLNVFSTAFTYSNFIVYRLFYFKKITLESAIREDGKKVNVLYIADRHYQRSVIVIDHSRNFKGIYSMVVTMEKYLSRKRKLLFEIEKKKT